MIVKICGIKTIEAAQVASEAGTDFLGFVFAPSKRRIQPEVAKRIAQAIPSHIKKVGVFVNDSVAHMLEIGAQVGLDIIQLHGDEPTEVAGQLIKESYQVIRAISADRLDRFTQEKFYPYDYVLIDSPPKTFRGGSGETFNWEILNDLPIDRRKLILAGGLTPENVQEAIQIVKPAGVDVSSGVETNGIKDHQKIKAFLRHARFAETYLS